MFAGELDGPTDVNSANMKLQLSLILLMGGAPLFIAHAQEPAPVAPVASPYDAALDRAFELGKLYAWDEARVELDKALKLAASPTDKAYVHGQIGAAYQEQKRYAEAAMQFRRIIAVPDVPLEQKKTAHLALATSLRDAKNYDAARREADLILADKSYALAPIERMIALSIRGDAQMDAKDWIGARRSYDAVLAVPANANEPMFDFTRAMAYYNVGKSYLRGGQALEARLQLRGVQYSLMHLPQGEAMTDFLGGATQQLIVESYMDEKDDAGARTELEQLLAMPNLPAAISKQAQEDLAKVKARLTAKQ